MAETLRDLHDRLVQIANELEELEQRRIQLLVEQARLQEQLRQRTAQPPSASAQGDVP
jgi:predicted transcriptional regulator